MYRENMMKLKENIQRYEEDLEWLENADSEKIKLENVIEDSNKNINSLISEANRLKNQIKESKADILALKNKVIKTRNLQTDIDKAALEIQKLIEEEKILNDNLRSYAHSGNLDGLNECIRLGGNVNYHHDTLCCAIREGYIEIVKCLVENGAKIFYGSICVSIIFDRIEIFKYFLTDRHIYFNKKTLFAEAVKWGRLEIIKYWVENDNKMISEENHNIMNAIRLGHLDVVKYLVEKRGNVREIIDQALEIATNHNHQDIAYYLIEMNMKNYI